MVYTLGDAEENLSFRPESRLFLTLQWCTTRVQSNYRVQRRWDCWRASQTPHRSCPNSMS
eukprot:5924612-Pyramimonas_sp.AAC.1